MPLARQTSPKIARVVALTALVGADVSDQPAGKRICAGRAGRISIKAGCLHVVEAPVDNGARRNRRLKTGRHARDLSQAVISDNPGSG